MAKKIVQISNFSIQTKSILSGFDCDWTCLIKDFTTYWQYHFVYFFVIISPLDPRYKKWTTFWLIWTTFPSNMWLWCAERCRCLIWGGGTTQRRRSFPAMLLYQQGSFIVLEIMSFFSGPRYMILDDFFNRNSDALLVSFHIDIFQWILVDIICVKYDLSI